MPPPTGTSATAATASAPAPAAPAVPSAEPPADPPAVPDAAPPAVPAASFGAEAVTGPPTPYPAQAVSVATAARPQPPATTARRVRGVCSMVGSSGVDGQNVRPDVVKNHTEAVSHRAVRAENTAPPSTGSVQFGVSDRRTSIFAVNAP